MTLPGDHQWVPRFLEVLESGVPREVAANACGLSAVVLRSAWEQASQDADLGTDSGLARWRRGVLECEAEIQRLISAAQLLAISDSDATPTSRAKIATAYAARRWPDSDQSTTETDLAAERRRLLDVAESVLCKKCLPRLMQALADD